MRKVFIYYSLTGNGAVIAKYLSDKGYETLRLETKHKMPKNKFMLMMVCGFLAFIKYKSKLKNFEFDYSNYDEIIIGSPDWNSNISTPIRSFISKSNIKDYTNVKAIVYSGGGEADKVIKQFNKIGINKVYSIKEPKHYTDELKKID